MMRSKLAIFLLVPFLMQCTHVTYRYTGEFQTQDGSTQGRFTSIQSTPLYGTATGCVLTFWVYGGFCWGYVLAPTSSDKRMVRLKTEDALMQALGKPVYIPLSPIAIEAWVQSEESVNYFLVKDSSAPAAPTESVADEPGTLVEVPVKPILEHHQNAPIKLLFPYMTGVGLSYEWTSPWKLSFEAGAVVHIANTRGLFAEVKFPIASSHTEVLKLGLVGAQIEQRKFDYRLDKYYYLVEKSTGLILEMESDHMPSFQLLYFTDKTHYEIIDIVFNLTYRLKL
ncbi:MAG TPA: hypothetical protein VE954_31695 [Oligoflexus sp.]|uniref:hypothetical protein n=1 Tax=Oligoflexus sp. TaxID=1971216 RepID=UPI002D3AA3C0|nr:hypothetical protein [Oligoflexus sp.]HYX37688.1 hypothetical protein [Oligoflexus sp.]